MASLGPEIATATIDLATIDLPIIEKIREEVILIQGPDVYLELSMFKVGKLWKSLVYNLCKVVGYVWRDMCNRICDKARILNRAPQFARSPLEHRIDKIVRCTFCSPRKVLCRFVVASLTYF